MTLSPHVWTTAFQSSHIGSLPEPTSPSYSAFYFDYLRCTVSCMFVEWL